MKRSLALIVVLALTACGGSASSYPPVETPPASSVASPPPPALSVPTTTAEPALPTPTGPAVSSASSSAYPDPKLTPGAVFPDATKEEVCHPGYAKSVRNVTSAEKAQVFARYGLRDVAGTYEVDHLISLELGGSNDIANLWPEPYEPRPGAHEKDKVEDALHAAVCGGRMTLAAAQTAIRTDWLAVYKTLNHAASAHQPTAS